jgi:hypothetical protein
MPASPITERSMQGHSEACPAIVSVPFSLGREQHRTHPAGSAMGIPTDLVSRQLQCDSQQCRRLAGTPLLSLVGLSSSALCVVFYWNDIGQWLLAAASFRAAMLLGTTSLMLGKVSCPQSCSSLLHLGHSSLDIQEASYDMYRFPFGAPNYEKRSCQRFHVCFC